ncbi:ankyrin repeat-containing protein [Penicillium cataractarum]|uniref:Ankyrin repeat-containing protein n=1 Tax=Penicillium cataractarum TaxID=2100454 RepID=A0A9W9UXV7_9EURO|nr:ankyrin repeat-containing protein [Penicillium cataractarum]KAJ5358841.1 ankyrin repeat-containing protein [Penicillium cataractarum]
MASNPITAADVISVVHAAADLTQTSYSYALDGDGWTEYIEEVSALIAVLFRIEHAILDMDITELLPSHSDSIDGDFLSDIHAQLARVHSKLQMLNTDNIGFQITEWREDIEALRKLQAAFSDLLSSSVMCVSKTEVPEVQISRMAATEGLIDIQEWSPLFGACFIGDLDRIRQLLSSNENYHIRTKFGWTVLHWAIIGKRPEVVQEIFEHHAQSHDLVNPFHRMKAAQLLSYSQAIFPVTLARKVQHIDVFNLVVQHVENPKSTVLLNRGWEQGKSDVKIQEVPMNPWRSMTRYERIHRFRIQALVPGTRPIPTANPKAIQSRPVEWIKRTSKLLCDAIRDQKFPMVQMLIRAGTDVNRSYALHIASFHEDPRYVKTLLAGGADPRVINKLTGRTALSEAILNGFVDTAAALIDGGADVNHTLCPPSSGERVGYLEPLVVKGYRIEMSNQGATSLMLACGFHFYSKRRVSKTAAIGAPQPPETALELFRLLLARGADSTVTDSLGMTVLHYAVLEPSPELIELLVDSGCSIEAIDREGRTPLQYLALCNEDGYETDKLEKVARLLSGHQSSSPLAKDLLNYPVTRAAASEQDDHSENLQPPLKKARSSHLVQVVRRMNRISYEEEDDEARTPILSALLAKRWKVVRVLADLGAIQPSKLDLEATPILDQVIEALEPQVLDLILAQGIIPSAGSILALVRSFISHRVDPKAAEDTDHIDYTKLCAKFHHMLAALASAGADINYRETAEEAASGTTPVVLAATIPGSRQILPALLALGGDLYALSTQYFDALRAAVVYGEPADLSFLVNHALRHPNASHWSHQLAQTPEEDNLLAQICSCLEEAGLLDSTNHHGRTLLHLAAEQDHTSLLVALLAHNASPNIRDQEDYLALHRAGFAKHAQAFTQLLPSSLSSSSLTDLLLSPVDEKDQVNLIDHAFLHLATPLITALLQHGLSPNHTVHPRHSDPRPALYLATSRNAHDIVTLLLASGADPNTPDSFGWRPLHVASLSGYSDIFSTLLTAGADIHACTRSWNTSAIKPTGLYVGSPWHGTPLHLAAIGGHVDLATALLARGADIHAETKASSSRLYFVPGHGPTALHLALDTGTFYGRPHTAEAGRVRVAGILVGAGARARGLLGQPGLARAVRLAKVPGLWDALLAMELEGEMDGDRNGMGI